MKFDNSIAIKKTSFIRFLVCVLCFSQASCGQTANTSLSKAKALSDVQLKSVNGWKEVISDEGRFRILFPDEPSVSPGSNGSMAMQGYKLIKEDANWFALYNDFDQPKTNDEAKLREAYRRSVEAITKNGSQLLRQNDVVLNGRLGSEFVIKSKGAISYMRAFIEGRRMYTLAVDSKRTSDMDSTLPKDVQQFFVSFTFWD